MRIQVFDDSYRSHPDELGLYIWQTFRLQSCPRYYAKRKSEGAFGIWNLAHDCRVQCLEMVVRELTKTLSIKYPWVVVIWLFSRETRSESMLCHQIWTFTVLTVLTVLIQWEIISWLQSPTYLPVIDFFVWLIIADHCLAHSPEFWQRGMEWLCLSKSICFIRNK